MIAHAKRIVRIIAGFVLLLVGAVMLVTPGPGWVMIALGLALLAVDFAWARRLLDRVKEQGIKLKNAVTRPETPES